MVRAQLTFQNGTPDAMPLHGGRDEGAASSSHALQEHQSTHKAEPQRPTYSTETLPPDAGNFVIRSEYMNVRKIQTSTAQHQVLQTSWPRWQQQRLYISLN